MIRADHFSMIIVLLFAVTLSWLQVSSGDFTNKTVLVPVPDDKSGIEMYVIRHDVPRSVPCGNVCDTVVVKNALGLGSRFSSVFVQASIAGHWER
tara:strand:- start:41465 stop:41749 length:285 start_codon:yes stop_codon:yes gene_type:complete